MEDSIGREIKLNDIVIYPDGNPRYGGLYLRVGQVSKLTASRATVRSLRIGSDKPQHKTTSKTGAKLLVVKDDDIALHLIGQTIGVLDEQTRTTN